MGPSVKFVLAIKDAFFNKKSRGGFGQRPFFSAPFPNSETSILTFSQTQLFTLYKNIFLLFSYSIWHNMFKSAYYQSLDCFYQIVQKDVVETYSKVEKKILLYFRAHLAVKSLFGSRLS